jgi:gliding motility-associatede transport system auxiliary component
MTMATQEKKRKVAAQTGIYLIVIAAILVVANLMAAGLYRRVDVTKNERFTLSTGSGRLLGTLRSPLEVDAYVTKGLPQLDVFVTDLTNLLKEYERAGHGKFKFTIINADTDELRQQAKDAGLVPTPFVAQSATGEDQASVAQGYMGLVFKYGDEKTKIPQLAPSRAEGLEFWITNKIREVRDKADDIKHRIGIITGKGELKLSDDNLVPREGRSGSPSIQSVLEQQFPFYKIVNVDLKDGDKAIDSTLDGVMITQPGKDYTDKELRRIDQFLMLGGKSLAVFASAVNLKPQDPSMQATLDTHGLDKLLSGYGIEMKKDAVMDYGAEFRLPVMTATGAVAAIRDPGIADVVDDPRFTGDQTLLDSSFPAFFRLDEVLFPFPSSLELLKDKQPKDVKLFAVARTTPAAGIDTSSTVDMKLRASWPPKPPFAQRIIAAVAKGKLKSAFSGPGKSGITANAVAPKPSRVLVVSSSLFITNPFAYAGNGPNLGGQFAMMGAIGGDPQLQMLARPYAERYLTNTILSVKDTLDWMSGDTDLLAASAKIVGNANLTYASVAKPSFSAQDDQAAIKKKDEDYREARKHVQRNVQWSLTLGVPVFFALFGAFRWRIKDNKKKTKAKV